MVQTEFPEVFKIEFSCRLFDMEKSVGARIAKFGGI